jgi:hypothetical protein
VKREQIDFNGSTEEKAEEKDEGLNEETVKIE